MKIKIDPKKNNKTPIISIITVVFNNFELIEKNNSKCHKSNLQKYSIYSN